MKSLSSKPGFIDANGFGKDAYCKENGFSKTLYLENKYLLW